MCGEGRAACWRRGVGGEGGAAWWRRRGVSGEGGAARWRRGACGEGGAVWQRRRKWVVRVGCKVGSGNALWV